MADETPIHEVRRVVIEYEIRVPTGPPPRAVAETTSRLKVDRGLIDTIKDELIRHGSRNPDIFGGRA